MKTLFALDADGVLVDYRKAFGQAWHAHFGELLQVQDPLAFTASRYWGVEFPHREHSFWRTFDELDLWAKMEPIEGAVEACQRLHTLGYELVCVTSMPFHHAERRQVNLTSHGFPIQQVIACGRVDAARSGKKDPSINPKKETLMALQPSWFVDDEWRKLQGLEGIGLGMIDPGYSEGINEHADHTLLTHTAPSLLDWVHWFEQQPEFHPTNTKNIQRLA